MSARVRVQARVYVNGKLRGKSRRRNLILDNFGNFLAVIISHHPLKSHPTAPLVDDGGLSRTVQIGTTSPTTTGLYYFYLTLYGNVGGYMRIGSGTTAPARGDYKIETPFTVAPESDYFEAGTGSYTAGTITISASITAGGSGTINETGFFLRMQDKDDSTIQRTYMIFHDAISPGVSFSAGDSITVEYSILL